MQDRPAGLVAALVPTLAAERPALRERILADVRAAAIRHQADAGAAFGGPFGGPSGGDTDEGRLVEAALDWILDRLRADGAVDDRALEALREAGAMAARRGEPVARPLDRVLSAGWVLWEAAVRSGAAEGPHLAALGAALLRIGDAAAAAIAAGHAEAEREAAARAAAARRELLDEILDLPAGDAGAAARVARRSLALGLDPNAAYDVLVADLGRDLGDDDPGVARLLAAAEPGPGRFTAPAGVAWADGRTRGLRLGVTPIAGTRSGRLVVVAEARWSGWSRLTEGLAKLADGAWVAVRAGGAPGIAAVAGLAGSAIATLQVAVRLGLRGRVLDPAALALERLVLGDPVLADSVVAAELGPLLADRRSGRALVETLAAYVATRGNARATARRLGVAPRTVAYRLERVRRLLGRPLEGEDLLRLTAAVFVFRTLDAVRGLERGG